MSLEVEPGLLLARQEVEGTLKELHRRLRVTGEAFGIRDLYEDLRLLDLVAEGSVGVEGVAQDLLRLLISRLVDPERAQQALDVGAHRRCPVPLLEQEQALLERSLRAEEVR